MRPPIPPLAVVLVSILAVSPATAEPAPGAPGDSARTLPANLWKADVRYVHARTGIRRITGSPDWAGKDHESSIINSLSSTDNGFGTSSLDYSATADVVAPSIFFGLTDRLTIGAALPVFVDAQVHLHDLEVGTGAFGYNPDFAADIHRHSPILAASDPRAVRGADAVRKLLTDVFDYEPLDDWRGSGLGDVFLVSRAALINQPNARVSLQTSASLPTGDGDNPDNLVDFGLGSGQVDLSVLALADAVVGGLTLNARGGYTMQLANEETARVYNHDSLPFAPRQMLPGSYSDLGSSQRVTRDLGDVWQVGGSAKLAAKSLRIGAGYDLFVKGEDRYESTDGPHLAMSSGTAYSVHAVTGELGLDLVDSFLRGKFPAPIVLNMSLTQSISEDDTSNVTIASMTATLFFGPSSSAPSQ